MDKILNSCFIPTNQSLFSTSSNSNSFSISSKIITDLDNLREIANHNYEGKIIGLTVAEIFNKVYLSKQTCGRVLSIIQPAFIKLNQGIPNGTTYVQHYGFVPTV